MKRPLVNITHWVHPPIIDYLENCGYQVLANLGQDSLPHHELMARSAQAQALMVFMPDTVDENFLHTCSNLRIIAGALKGYDNFDVESCSRHGVWFCNVPDLLTIPTAELTLGILLIMARRLHQADQIVRGGSFKGWRPILYSQGLYQQAVGIIGLGKLGQATAKLLHALGVRILGYDPLPMSEDKQETLGLSQVALPYLLAESHYVLVQAPLNQESYHMINRDTIALMRPGAYLINVGRGSVVEESDVADALCTGHLAGYGADVFAFEDWALGEHPGTIDKRLLAMPDKTFFTPHIGSATEKARLAIAMEAAANIHDALSGRRPRNAINLPAA